MTSPEISGYKFEASRGSGAFGVVWRAYWNGEFECAVKALEPGMWHPQYLSWCLERLRREGERTDLVRVFSYDLAHTPPHIAMAMMPEGTPTMERLAGKLPARDAWMLLDQLASTLAWLHGEGIVHTGLSAGNVFVAGGPSGEPVVLVSDIGQGWLSDAPVARLHGQLAYIAPEHWREATKLLQEGRAQSRDVYAFGVLAWRLLNGTWPRGSKVFGSIMDSHGDDLILNPLHFADWLEKEALGEWPGPEGSDEEAARRQVVLQCLALNPAERPADMKVVVKALQLCALPPSASTETAEEIPAAVADANGDGQVDTADAFVEEKPAPPRRGFRIPFPKLGFGRRKEADVPVPGAAGWRLASGLLALGVAGAVVWAMKERGTRITASNDREALRRTNEEISSRLPRLEAAAAAAASDAEAARSEQAAATRQSSVELISRILAAQPVEDTQLPAWRTAVRVVAEQFQGVMEKAPADAGGMEARWQLARVKNALGDDAGALPLLEKLSRELEAAAISAGQEFPAELVRLTGRVASLTGLILTSQSRTEDAMPHLRRASDAFERWLTTNSGDTDTSRSLAQNLLLEGRSLGARGQIEQGRAALMKIEGLIGKSGDSGFKAEDRFLLADAQIESGRLDFLQATADAGKPNAASLIDSAISRLNDGLAVLIEYDNQVDKKSIANRIRMARAFHELGRMLARSSSLGGPREASVAYGESVKVYSELIADVEDNASYNFELAGLCNDAAQLTRDSTPGPEGATKALDYQSPSLEFLQDYNVRNPLNNSIRLLLATSLALNGELQQQAGQSAAALKRFTEAITLTGELLTENTLSEKERREARRVSARAWTGTAGLHEKAGRPKDAIEALTKAMADWESSPVEDPSDQKLMAWVKDKLNKVK